MVDLMAAAKSIEDALDCFYKLYIQLFFLKKCDTEREFKSKNLKKIEMVFTREFNGNFYWIEQKIGC